MPMVSLRSQGINLDNFVTFSLHVRGPEREIVSEELHDERGVLVALFGEGVQLCYGVVEGGFGQPARTVGRVQDLVVEHRKVEGQTKTGKRENKEL